MMRVAKHLISLYLSFLSIVDASIQGRLNDQGYISLLGYSLLLSEGIGELTASYVFYFFASWFSARFSG